MSDFGTRTGGAIGLASISVSPPPPHDHQDHTRSQEQAPDNRRNRETFAIFSGDLNRADVNYLFSLRPGDAPVQQRDQTEDYQHNANDPHACINSKMLARSAEALRCGRRLRFSA